ncbi:MAG: hypothetical protein KAT34_15010 [Candidatus Aminicenantes bacterium]|nr:hypothetical protein [Candidatus Aminicenantes bacterium]
MQLVGIAEVTQDHNLEPGKNIKGRLQPGEKVKIMIEPINIDSGKEKKRKRAIGQLLEISRNSKVGLYSEHITRADAHDRENPPGI